MTEQNQNDVLEQLEKTVQELHSKNEKLSRPLTKKYPLLSAFIFTFSVASILYGFELIMQKIPFIVSHPYILIVLGCALLFVTGSLYKINK